MNNVEQAHQWW